MGHEVVRVARMAGDGRRRMRQATLREGKGGEGGTVKGRLRVGGG